MRIRWEKRVARMGQKRKTYTYLKKEKAAVGYRSVLLGGPNYETVTDTQTLRFDVDLCGSLFVIYVINMSEVSCVLS